MAESAVLQVFVFRNGEYIGSEMYPESEIRIGSGPDVQLHLDDARIAPLHALISHGQGRMTVRNLEPTEGTFINRQPVGHAYVTARDEIQIGDFTLKLKLVARRRSSLRPPPAAALISDLTTEEPPIDPMLHPSPPRISSTEPSIDREKRRATIDQLITRELDPEDAFGLESYPPFDATAAEAGFATPEDLLASIDEAMEAAFGPPAGQTEPPIGSTDDLLKAAFGLDTEIRPSSIPKVLPEAPTIASATVPDFPSRTEAEDAPAQQRSRSKSHHPDSAAFPSSNLPVDEPGTDSQASDRKPLSRPSSTTATEPPDRKSPKASLFPPPEEPFSYPDLYLNTVDSEEEDDEDDARPPFSLLETLESWRPPKTSVDRSAFEIIDIEDGKVRSTTLLTERRSRYRSGHRPHGALTNAGHPALRSVRLLSGGRAKVEFSSEADGFIVTGRDRHSLDRIKTEENAISKRKNAYRVELSSNRWMTLSLGSHRFILRFIAPPPLPPAPASKNAYPLLTRALASSVGIHVLLALVVGILAPGVVYSDVAHEEWAKIKEDDLRDVEIKPEPPPPPEPEPPAETEPEPVSEPPPPASTPRPRTHRTKRGAPKKEVKKAGVLGAMGKLNLKAPGRKSMVQAVSNLDAVRAPGDSNFRVGSLVGKTPSSRINVGGGGGGAPLTRGSAELIRSGNGFAKIGRRGGSTVRGRVTRVSSRRLQATGKISREQIARVINQHLGEVQYCYETQLLKEPSLKGKLVLEWSINTSGSVGRVKQKLSTMQSPKVSSCIIASLKRWKFPKPQGGTVVVSYPFIFSSVGF